jgi:DNA polymerase-4
VTVKIRSAGFETVTRSRTLDAPTDSTLEVLRVAKGLFRTWAARDFEPLRLVGVRLERVDAAQAAAQPGLFADERAERARLLDRVSDAISRKHGPGAIGLGARATSNGAAERPRDPG